VGIVGAGPAGISAAAFLAELGHGCTVYDLADAPWSALVAKVGPDRLSGAAAEIDYAAAQSRGVKCITGWELQTAEELDALLSKHDAILLACGDEMRSRLKAWGLPDALETGGVESRKDGVFLCGGLRAPSRLAVRAVRDAQIAAAAINAFLGGNRSNPEPVFDSHAGHLSEDQIAQFAARSLTPEKSVGQRPTPMDREGTVTETRHCMGCDCRAKDNCALRNYADDYGIRQVHAHPPTMAGESLFADDHPQVSFEPGKCIRCGLCVRLAEARGEALGLTFTGRGRKTRLSVPFGESWAKALEHCADECITICPTGALTRLNQGFDNKAI
jgi:ferredoxin